MKTLIKLFLLIVILHVFFAGCSDTSESDASEDELETAIVTADNTATTAPVIAEVTAVTTPTNDTTPDYTFSHFPLMKKEPSHMEVPVLQVPLLQPLATIQSL